MKYRLYHSLTNPFQPYKPGDRLWFDPTEYEITPRVSGTKSSVLEAIFQRHNSDYRPDGHLAPSLSVGDVVAFGFDTEDPEWWAVDSVGFRLLDQGPYLGEVDESPRWTEAAAGV